MTAKSKTPQLKVAPSMKKLYEFVQTIAKNLNVKVTLELTDDRVGAEIVLNHAVYLAPTIVEVDTLNGPKPVPGYYVYVVVEHYNYPHEPNDYEPVDIYTGNNIHDATVAAFKAVVKDIVDAAGEIAQERELDEQLKAVR